MEPRRNGKVIVAALAVLGFCAAALAADAPAGKCAGDEKELLPGLVAHYFKDPDEWMGMWRPGEKPVDDPADWTFTKYKYSRIEPLINHQFIRRGWFTVRWDGYLKISPGESPLGKVEPAEYNFELWADDGCRLSIDGKMLIDSWRECAEPLPESHRAARIVLAPGCHKIAVEYFQGQSLPEGDKDPMKLYWMSLDAKIPEQIVPASHFAHGAEDVAPPQERSKNAVELAVDEVGREPLPELRKERSAGPAGRLKKLPEPPGR